MYCVGITSCCCPTPPYVIGALCVTLDGVKRGMLSCCMDWNGCMDDIGCRGCCEWWYSRGCCMGRSWPEDGASGWEEASEKEEAESVEPEKPERGSGGSDTTVCCCSCWW